MQNSANFLNMIERGKPKAMALIRGNRDHPDIFGTVHLYQTREGVLLIADVSGLPGGAGGCGSRVFGFHIHEGGSCTGNDEDPYANSGTHYNPSGCKHPQHAGDLPPLFESNGRAFMAVLSNRFTVAEVLGRVFIIHNNPDDFTTQPSGASGEKIACGEIRFG